MRSMHANVLAGRAEDNAHFATDDVIVDDVGDVRHGRDSFVEIVAARRQGQGALPEKQIRDEYIIADGRLGMIGYLWHGKQMAEYLSHKSLNPTTRSPHQGLLGNPTIPPAAPGATHSNDSVCAPSLLIPQLDHLHPRKAVLRTDQMLLSHLHPSLVHQTGLPRLVVYTVNILHLSLDPFFLLAYLTE